MRFERAPSLVLCSLFASTFAACDSVDVGRPEIKGDPILYRIVIQDEFPGGTFVVTDLLNDADPEAVACNDSNPCPGELLQVCVPTAEGSSDGFCDDPLNPRAHPPEVGIPRMLGGNQIRLVFDQVMDHALDAALMEDMSDAIIGLRDPNGRVDVVKYLDNAGGHDYSSIPQFEPFGPALVMKPVQSLNAGTTYTITLDPTQIKDAQGETPKLARKVGAQPDPGVDIPTEPIQTEYTFTTGGLVTAEIIPDVTADGAVIAPNDVIQVAANAPIAEAATGTAAAAGVEVRDEGGNVVPVRAFNYRDDPSDCEGTIDARLLVIVPTSTAWQPGMYTISFAGVAAPVSGALLDGGETTGTFTVEGEPTDPAEDPSARENFVTPEDCEAE